LFIRTNVASWDEQAALFKQAYDWSGGRIDFFAANAGLAERDHITMGFFAQGWNLEGEPPKPDLLALEVNETAVFYGLRLFVHYARKTKLALQASSASKTVAAPFNPKVVITASCAAIYPFPLAPAYNASKHAVLGLTRGVGKPLLASDNIAVNCIMPGYVDTGLTPKEVTNLWPPHFITPISTMVRAYDELTSETGAVAQDGKSDGKHGEVKAGQSVECVVDKLFYRQPVPYADESQEFLIEQTFLPDGVWARGMGAAVLRMQAAAAASEPTAVAA
jgi:15-hydroxyprostaglandin dehydrogenase (NAD)